MSFARNGGLQDAIDALKLLAAGVIRPRIVGRYPLADINQALRQVREGQTPGRVIIQFRE